MLIVRTTHTIILETAQHRGFQSINRELIVRESCEIAHWPLGMEARQGGLLVLSIFTLP